MVNERVHVHEVVWWKESKEDGMRGWWRKADVRKAWEIKRATKRRKSIFNFAGKHPHKQRCTLAGDSFGCFILHLRENVIILPSAFQFPQTWELYDGSTLSHLGTSLSVLLWPPPLVDYNLLVMSCNQRKSAKCNNETNHCSISVIYPLDNMCYCV